MALTIPVCLAAQSSAQLEDCCVIGQCRLQGYPYPWMESNLIQVNSSWDEYLSQVRCLDVRRVSDLCSPSAPSVHCPNEETCAYLTSCPGTRTCKGSWSKSWPAPDPAAQQVARGLGSEVPGMEPWHSCQGMGSQSFELQGCLEGWLIRAQQVGAFGQMQLCHHTCFQEEIFLLSCDKPSSSLVLMGAASPLSVWFCVY